MRVILPGLKADRLQNAMVSRHAVIQRENSAYFILLLLLLQKCAFLRELLRHEGKSSKARAGLHEVMWRRSWSRWAGLSLAKLRGLGEMMALRILGHFWAGTPGLRDELTSPPPFWGVQGPSKAQSRAGLR